MLATAIFNGAVDGYLGNSANYPDGHVPANGDNLELDPSAQTTVTNNLPTLSLNTLTFVGSNYNFTGNALQVTGGISVAPGMAVMLGPVAGGNDLVKQGDGALQLTGADTYTGATVVDTGTLVVSDTAALPDETSVIVGAGGNFTFDPIPRGQKGSELFSS